MQRSFSIVDDEDADEQTIKKYGSASSHRRTPQNVSDFEKNLARMATGENSELGTGSSGRRTVLRASKSRLSVESDLEDSDEDDVKKSSIPGEYNPKQYDDLDVSVEIKDVFQYITKYIPQEMTLDYKFKSFVPEFIPAVGDIDAFLKVIPPEENSGSDCGLGLVVLDEPAANQSDSALLHLQLRAESVSTSHHNDDVVVKKVDNVERNGKVIDKWIKDVSALHKSKSFPAVRYTEAMPDLDELMQEWSEEKENKLKEEGFPKPLGDLGEYIEKVCETFQIPVKNKMQSLHLLFSLYAAVKGSQLFKSTNLDKNEAEESLTNVTDQLVLE